MTLILDSSVIAKWYFKEENSDLARRLLEQHQVHLIQITSPILLFFEIGNIFINKKLTAVNFSRHIQDLLALNLTIINTEKVLLKNTFAIALNYQLSFYDATYVALAQKLKCDFITADKKLYQKTKGLKSVKLLKTI